VLAAAQNRFIYATPDLADCYGAELAEAFLDQTLDEQRPISGMAECTSPSPQEASPAYERLRVNAAAYARRRRGHGPDNEDKRATITDAHEQAAQHDTSPHSTAPQWSHCAPHAHDNSSNRATGMHTPVGSRPSTVHAPSCAMRRATPTTVPTDRVRPLSAPPRAPIFTRLGDFSENPPPDFLADERYQNPSASYMDHWIDAAGRPAPRVSLEEATDAQEDGIHSGESEIDGSSSSEE